MSPDKSGSLRDWICIDTGEHSGRFNMDFDVRLVNEFGSTRKPILRFFTWDPYCISLGKNQSDSDIDARLAEQDGIEVVRRPTGGKAVLHAEELTYSVITNTDGLSVRESYNLISKALVIGLKTICADLELSQSSADFRKLFHDPATIPCFSTSAVSEVEWHGKKLVGSAQHRFGDVLLQHGSILIGDFHKQIVKYLNVKNEIKQKTLADLDSHTVTLTEILGKRIELAEIIEAVKNGFGKVFGADFQPSKAAAQKNNWTTVKEKDG